MALEMPGVAVARSGLDTEVAAAPLRLAVIAVALGWAAAFLFIGVHEQLQMYGDGSLFSYAVSVQEAWAYHWHNISGRIAVFTLTCLPAQAYVALTGSAQGGIMIYGALFFGAQLFGLATTYAADRSPGRIIFHLACISTALLCPLVFGFVTEMWMAHALFWPALALCHFARRGAMGWLSVFATLLALCFTHEGALILSGIIIAGLALRGFRDARFLRAVTCGLAVLAIWAAVKIELPPDAYDAPIMADAAEHFFNLWLLSIPVLLVLSGALTAYGLLFLLLRRLFPARAHVVAAAGVACGLAVYWIWFDQTLLGEDRYFLRTVVLIGTAGLGLLAGAGVLDSECRPPMWAVLSRQIAAALTTRTAALAGAGALALVTLVHAVETGKFVREWMAYRGAVERLAMGKASDPSLGDAHFVSAARIAPELNQLSWTSTTPYLSVLLAPGFLPKRLVIDPDQGYYWLTCAMAKATEQGARAVPVESRMLLRVHACLHR